MDDGNGKPVSLPWRTLYEAALVELDPKKLPHRIAEAECAILNRMEDLNRSAEGSESGALINALNAMRDLRKMMNGSGS